MFTILLVLHVCVCLALIGLVLIQRGKGADIGASFGSGASHTVFGSQGAGDFLSRATGWLAAAFFILSLMMTQVTYREQNVTFEDPDSYIEQGSVAPSGVPVIPD